MKNIAVIDDDKMFLPVLTGMLDKEFQRRCVPAAIHGFHDPWALINAARSGVVRFDAFFLDIVMPTKRGTTLARELRDLDPACKIVLVTAYSLEIYDAFHYRVDAFIPKSDLAERLPGEVSQILSGQNDEQSAKKLVFEVEKPGSDSTSLLALHAGTIVYFETTDRKIYMHTVDGAKHIVRKRDFRSIREEFQHRNFVIVHRGLLVNLSHVRAVHNGDVELDMGKHLEVSRRMRGNTRCQFILYAKGGSS